MAKLADLEDVDLTTVALDDGTPLLAAWRSGGGQDGAATGFWEACQALPASAVTVELDPMVSRLVPGGLVAPTASVQDRFASLYRDGLNIFRRVTDDDVDLPMQTRLCLLTDYRRDLPYDQLGGNGALFGLSYGAPGAPAGGNVNVTTIGVEIRASEDPANEVGGCIASLQLGKGTDPPPTGSLWGASYTLRGSVGRQPGGLMAYTAVVQNYFDGSGSRSDNYGYAAVTRPGIGDGEDFHVHDPIRHATTYPVDHGFVVCGDSGPYPEGGGIGFKVAFQAGGAASPWAPREQWRTRIGTGLLVRDWLEAGIHVQPPHHDAAAVPQLRLDRRDHQKGNYLECRSEDGLGLIASIGPDGRMRAAPGQDDADVVTVAQLEEALAALRADLRADLSGVSARRLGRELAARCWRTARRRVRQVVSSAGAR
ncbi:MAG: hypothetical protein JJU45_10065 [Acidimicrobiia bacterium]|nr:hypothetical protein [Acidimicrobiia bacterium]